MENSFNNIWINFKNNAWKNAWEIMGETGEILQVLYAGISSDILEDLLNRFIGKLLELLWRKFCFYFRMKLWRNSWMNVKKTEPLKWFNKYHGKYQEAYVENIWRLPYKSFWRSHRRNPWRNAKKLKKYIELLLKKYSRELISAWFFFFFW